MIFVRKFTVSNGKNLEILSQVQMLLLVLLSKLEIVATELQFHQSVHDRRE